MTNAFFRFLPVNACMHAMNGARQTDRQPREGVREKKKMQAYAVGNPTGLFLTANYPPLNN